MLKLENKMDIMMQLLIDETKNAEVRFQSLTSKMENVETRTDQVEKRISMIENESSDTIHVVDNLVAEMNQLKQDKLCKNIIVRGILEKETCEADLNCFINKMFSLVTDDVTTNDTVYFGRIGEKDQKFPRPISIKFKTDESKQRMLKLKKKKSLNCSMFDAPGSSNSTDSWGTEADLIFFGDHMTFENKKLNQDARKLRDEKKVIHVWILNGTTFVRKEKGDRGVRIQSELDIEKISGEPRRSQRRRLNSPEIAQPDPKKDKNSGK